MAPPKDGSSVSNEQLSVSVGLPVPKEQPASKDPKNLPVLLLVDGHSIAHRAYWALIGCVCFLFGLAVVQCMCVCLPVLLVRLHLCSQNVSLLMCVYVCVAAHHSSQRSTNKEMADQCIAGNL